MSPDKSRDCENHEQEQTYGVKFPVLIVHTTGSLAFQSNRQDSNESRQQQPFNKSHPEFFLAIRRHDEKQKPFAQPGKIGGNNCYTK